MCRQLFKSVFLLKYTFAIFYTGWYFNKYTLHIFVFSKLVEGFFKLYLPWYQTCHDYFNDIGKSNKLYQFERYHAKTSFHLMFFLDMVIFLHINTPWIKQYWYICCGSFSVNLLILVQETIGIYIICARFESFPMCSFCMTSISKVLVFLNFVYNPMGAASTGAASTGSTPNTLYILMHNFIIS